MKKLTLFLIALLLSGGICLATDYYVRTDGNDGNTGQGEGTGDAWATINKVNISSFNPDDNIYFYRGHIWREQLTVPDSGSDGNLITFGAYGSGDLPLIMGSTLEASWTQVGGTDVWYCTGYSSDPINVWLDGLSYWEAANAGAVDSTDRWYYDGGANRVYVYATEDPSTFYSSSGVEIPIRNDVIYCNEDYVRLENLHLKYGHQYTLRFHTGADYCEAIDLTIDGSGDVAAFILNGTTNCTVDNCTINGDSKPDQNNTFYNLLSTSNTIKNCTIRNGSHCTVFLNKDTDTIFEYNEVYSEYEFGRTIAVQAGSGDGSGRIVRYNWFYDSQTDDTPHADSGAQWDGVDDRTYYNIFSGGQDWMLQVYNYDAATTGQKFYNNVFHGSEDQGIRINLTTHVGADAEFKNNVFMSNDSTNHFQISCKLNNDTTKATFINNVIYDSNTASTVEVQGVARTVAYMETNHAGTYSGNIVDDPLFVNAGGSFELDTDFLIPTGSPCKDAGANVGLSLDYWGNLVPSGAVQDVGSHEYQQGDIPVLRIRDVLRIRNVLRIK